MLAILLPITAIPAGAGPTNDADTRVTRAQQAGPDMVHATAVLPIRTHDLLAVLEQPCHVRQWMPDLEMLTLLTQQGEQSLVYMRMRAPWPMRSRDAVTRFTRHQADDGTVTLTMQGDSDAIARVPGVVRMPFIAGQWRLIAEETPEDTPEGKPLTRVDYQQRVDPGGGVPQWLADRAAVRHVGATLAALEAYVERGPDDSDCEAAGQSDTGDGDVEYQPGNDG